MQQKGQSQQNVGVIIGYIISGIVVLLCVVTSIAMVVTNGVSKDNKLVSRKAQKVIKNNYTSSYITDYDLGEFKFSLQDSQKKVDKSGKGKDAMGNPDAYIIANSNTTALSDADLSGLSAKELTFAKAEILARHGITFNEKEFSDYFGSKHWYTPNPHDQIAQVEIDNIDFIDKYQEKHNLTYIAF
ncbi:YARHG domain-containing protein [Lachnobacterium bovis]|uniref:YARHG domain-containing protein n=1 Tax=Lachnobacterium bovis DSM 14045 TaxID=1122142 RepID=A0A1H3I208_9FIRM|nr:YARHG domain-containing protein [Lachnobacterium bovis]SDY21455.1 YARHG domain-containing protein [Lachnobacterium bovis DSM 14045]